MTFNNYKKKKKFSAKRRLYWNTAKSILSIYFLWQRENWVWMDRDQYGPQRSQTQKMYCKSHLYGFMEKAQQYTQRRDQRLLVVQGVESNYKGTTKVRFLERCALYPDCGDGCTNLCVKNSQHYRIKISQFYHVFI